MTSPTAAEALPSAWRPAAGWRDILAGRDPDVILERLLDGDPLRLRGLVGRAIRRGCYFLDADRVHLRTLARIAHDVTIDGPPADGAWVQAHVSGALDDLLRSERRAIVTGAESDLETLRVLSAPLALEGADLRIACDSFNRLALADRQAFFALFVERLELDGAASSLGVSAALLARRARAALTGITDAVANGIARRVGSGAVESSPSTSPSPSSVAP